MHYDYVPLSQRKPLRWPNGSRLALILTFNLEYWDLTRDTDGAYYAGGPAILPDPLPGNVPDFPNYTWREYGQRVGIWRLMDIFDRAGVLASCTMNAKMGLERQAVIDAANERGWELVAHNYVQTDLLTNYFEDPEKEREVILETLRVYEDTVGRPARGWLSSSLRCNASTVETIAEQGLIYTNDFMNDDQPYLIQTGSGPHRFRPLLQRGQRLHDLFPPRHVERPGVRGAQGPVRRALPGGRGERTADERRHSPACLGSAVPRPGATRFPRIMPRVSRASGSPSGKRSPSGISKTTRAISADRRAQIPTIVSPAFGLTTCPVTISVSSEASQATA